MYSMLNSGIIFGHDVRVIDDNLKAVHYLATIHKNLTGYRTSVNGCVLVNIGTSAGFFFNIACNCCCKACGSKCTDENKYERQRKDSSQSFFITVTS